jgi:hypothetical protein
MRIRGDEVVRRAINIGEVTTPAARDQDFLPSALGTFEHSHATAAFAGLDRAHEASRTRSENQDIKTLRQHRDPRFSLARFWSDGSDLFGSLRHRFSIPPCTVYSCLNLKDTSSSAETSGRLTTRAEAAIRKGNTNYRKRSSESWQNVKSRVQQFAPISLDVWSNRNMVPRSWCTQMQYGTAGSRWKTSTRSSTPISFEESRSRNSRCLIAASIQPGVSTNRGAGHRAKGAPAKRRPRLCPKQLRRKFRASPGFPRSERLSSTGQDCRRA